MINSDPGVNIGNVFMAVGEGDMRGRGGTPMVGRGHTHGFSLPVGPQQSGQ